MPRKLKPRGPGRPVSTGSSVTTPINYRVSAQERAAFDAEAKRRGLDGGANAAAKALALEALQREES